MVTIKTAYLSPSTGTLEITAVRSLQPTASIVLDLGIPNFTVFSIKFPISSSDPMEFRQVSSEALGVMLDEMTAFMISTGYKQNVIAGIYALALDCYKGMIANDNPAKREKDPTIGSIRGAFRLPPEFINETQKCVVTAAKTVKRSPRERKLEFTPSRPLTPSKNDVLKAIKRYRFQSIKSQPYPLYLVVYDNMGRPKGTLSLGPGFHNELLKMQYKKKGSENPQTEQAKTIVEQGGGVFKGMSEGINPGEMLAWFDTPHRSTLFIPLQGLTVEAVEQAIEQSEARYAQVVKRAGQWGLRSYDGDSAHDILDRYRPKGEDTQGFDEPVPEDRLPDLVAELNSMDLGTPDAKQDYLAVVVFLVTHGSDIPDDLRQCALGIAHELHGDTEGRNPGGTTDRGYKLWKDPLGRKKELEKEMAILEGDSAKVASLWGIEKQVKEDFDPDVLIDPLTNIFGKLQPEYRNKLKRLLLKPSHKTWNDAFSIIVSGGGKFMTLWQAVIAVDPWFPRTGPREDFKGNLISGWEKIPDRKTIIQALRYANPVKHEKKFNPDDLKFLESMGIKTSRFLRTEEMRAWGQGRQDEYYSQHPELGSPGKKLNLMVTEPDGTSVPLAKAVRADHTNAEGYWAGEGNAASGILPICTTTGRICLAWRSPYVNEGSCWGTIGGAVKRGMQPGPSAEEELAEETGYTGDIKLYPAFVFTA
jgi:hypothetical protein